MQLAKPFLFLAAALAAVFATLRRRRVTQSDSDLLWREATADASR